MCTRPGTSSRAAPRAAGPSSAITTSSAAHSGSRGWRYGLRRPTLNPERLSAIKLRLDTGMSESWQAGWPACKSG